MFTEIWHLIAVTIAGVFIVIGAWFTGKKVGTTKTQAKADVEKAEVKAEATKAAAKHETLVTGNANEAKAEVAGRTDSELRDRMHDKFTRP